MPSYITSAQTQQVTALYPGQSKALINNAATDASVTTTMQVFIGPDIDAQNTINVNNTTNQTMTGQIAAVDSTANYSPYVGMVVAANTATSFNLANAWLRFTCTAPTSGSLIVSR